MKNALFAAAFLFSTLAFAGRPETYRTLAELKAKESDFYKLTCSETSKKIQTHVYAVVEQGKLTKLKMLVIEPGVSMNSTEFEQKYLPELTYKLDNTGLSIEGQISRSYFGEDFELNLSQGRNTLNGKLYYYDNDGYWIRADNLKCAAVNYGRGLDIL